MVGGLIMATTATVSAVPAGSPAASASTIVGTGGGGLPRLLITGGAGFLAYHVARGLHGKDFQVELLDLGDYEEGDYANDIVLHQGDVRDRDRLIELFSTRNYRAVVHAAAALPLWPNRMIYDVNIAGTRNVVELARRFGVERVVNISSTAVYGVPEKHPLEEDDPLIGVGAYGTSKIEAEDICRQFRAEGYCVPTLRPKTFIGTGRLGVFQILFDWIQNGVKIPVIGSGNNHYQLLDVRDLVDAIRLCLLDGAALVNQDFNVGATRYGTVREDLTALCKVAGSGARVMGTPAGPVKTFLRLAEIVKLSPLYKWVYGTADRESFASVERIESALGWKPKYSNAEALINAYKWYLEHADEVNAAGSGVTHRVAWKQGILGLFKKVL